MPVNLTKYILRVTVHMFNTNPIKLSPGYMSENPHHFAINNVSQIMPLLNLYFTSSFPSLPWAYVGRYLYYHYVSSSHLKK